MLDVMNCSHRMDTMQTGIEQTIPAYFVVRNGKT
jgi:hypothetical protein